MPVETKTRFSMFNLVQMWLERSKLSPYEVYIGRSKVLKRGSRF